MGTAAQLFAMVKDEIPGYNGAAFGTLDGSGFEADGADMPSVGADLASIARSWHQTWRDLGGAVDFGSNDDVLISATKGYLLIKVNHDKQTFLAVALKANGNIGYLRFRMRDYLRRITG